MTGHLVSLCQTCPLAGSSELRALLYQNASQLNECFSYVTRSLSIYCTFRVVHPVLLDCFCDKVPTVNLYVSIIKGLCHCMYTVLFIFYYFNLVLGICLIVPVPPFLDQPARAYLCLFFVYNTLQKSYTVRHQNAI